jgi:predicted nucleotidyltransferase component of viral defense system
LAFGDQLERGRVITNREIALLAGEWGLRHDVVEKDYVLGWLLAGIAHHPVTSQWAFKGGTCLRKCWFETYRFSEDLDFTVSPDDIEPAHLNVIFAEIADWLENACGLKIQFEESSFRIRRNRRDNATIEGRIGYNGPLATPTPPKVKLDLTSDEAIVMPLELRPILHPFSDVDTPGHPGAHLADVLTYPLPELMGEKLRALAERCRPRDLYDVIHMYRHPDLLGRDSDVAHVLEQKCVHAGIDVPTLQSMIDTPFRTEIETEWHNMLAHQLPFLPPFDSFWSDLSSLFEWLGGRMPIPALPTATASGVSDWVPARYMTTWKTGAPLELIRFAGANRLKVMLDYRPETGRVGPRVVEPYSLRRSTVGDLLLFVTNDHGQLRSYRVDRIRGASILNEVFTPRFRVEF